MFNSYEVFLAAIGNIENSAPEDLTKVGRFLYNFQAFLGYFVVAGALGYLVTKLNRPNPDTFIFSQRAFYVSGLRRFGVLVVNTSSDTASNIRFMGVVRYFRRHSAPQEYCLPYLGTSALFFFLDEFDINNVDAKLFDPSRDGIKVALSCEVNQLHYSTAVKYGFEDIIVVENTDFMDRPLFEEPDFTDSTFWGTFHAPVANAPTLHTFITDRRKLALDEAEETPAVNADVPVTIRKSRSSKSSRK